MISIADLLSEEYINLDLLSRKKNRLIDELVQLPATAGEIKDPKALADQIITREALASTGIGHGIGIPHCLTDQADHTIIVFGRSIEGVPFDGADNKPVHLVFLLVGPKSATAKHLQLLSKMSRLLTREEFRKELMAVDTPMEVIDLFRREEQV